MSIAEQMGKTLQRTSISTNIKERLDFSCALFGVYNFRPRFVQAALPELMFFLSLMVASWRMHPTCRFTWVPCRRPCATKSSYSVDPASLVSLLLVIR